MLLLAGGLSGCVETTQQKNARATLDSARLLASRSAVQVKTQDPTIKVLKVDILRGRAGTAVAVTLRNDATTPVSDLPISVGVKTRGGRAVYLNRNPELSYFQTHIAGVGANAQATWAFTSRRAAPHGDVFARVGPPALPLDKHVARLPAIVASAAAARSAGRGRAVVNAVVANRSGVSQTALQVYAFALSGERLLAAGSASIKSLGSGAESNLQIPLVGNPGASAVQLQAPPTHLR